MASIAERFEEVELMYRAIRDIDLIQMQTVSGPGDSRLDQVYNAISGIDRANFDKSIEDEIIIKFKELIVLSYNKKMTEINEDMNRPRIDHGIIDDLANE